MREQELYAFVAVAETGQMNLAAKNLGYSQPAITYQIKGLEQSLGTKLFIRAAEGARLTDEGKAAFPTIKAILALIEQLRAATGIDPSMAADAVRDNPFAEAQGA
ncbi:helix-turn-helix domain-containing protein [Streptosporangium sp. KLBMP 9127]